MADIVFTCPHCSSKVKTEDEWIGMSAECPHCGKEIVISEPEKADIQKQNHADSVQMKSSDSTEDDHSDVVAIVEDIDYYSPKGVINESTLAIYIEDLLGFFRKKYFLNFYDINEKLLVKCGLFGLIFCAVIGLITSLVFPIRYYGIDYKISIAFGILWFFICLVLYYIAWKFIPNIIRIINSTPTKVCSQAFLNCTAFVILICGVTSFFRGLYTWAKISNVEDFFSALIILIFSLYFIILCLNPKILNIQVTKQVTAGEELIGLLSFFMKGFLKITPIVFGYGIIFSDFCMVQMLFTKCNYVNQVFYKFFQAGSLVSCALLPIIAYIVFLFYYFFIDLARALLSIPSKIDNVNERK